jgi:cell division GTPase FtsZ
MKAMAKKMEEGLQGSEKEQMEEDVKMLRQVLDNFSFFFIAGICDGTIQGSQKRFSGFQ